MANRHGNCSAVPLAGPSKPSIAKAHSSYPQVNHLGGATLVVVIKNNYADVHSAAMASTAASTSSSPSSSQSSSPSNTRAPSASSGSASGVSTTTIIYFLGTAAPSNSGNPSASSQAWIAGVVIGSIAVLAVLGFAAFWFGWRKANQKKTLQADQPAEHIGAQFLPSVSHQTPQYQWKPEQVEVEPQPQPQEMPTHEGPATGTWTRPAELESDLNRE